MDVDQAADELYSLQPDDFLARRSELVAAARSDGDRDVARDISKLRKPTLAAALINVIARQSRPELDALRAVADDLRRAHRTLQGEELRALSRDRHEIVQRLLERVQALADDIEWRTSDAVLSQVRQTYEAAIASEEALTAVLSGRLTTSLSYSGFGEVEIGDAVAVPARPRHLASVPTPAQTEPTQAEQVVRTSQPSRSGRPAKPADSHREQDLLDAQAVQERAQASVREAEATVTKVRSEQRAAGTAVAELEAKLDAARNAAIAVARELREAERSRESARSAAQRATARLEALRRRARNQE